MTQYNTLNIKLSNLQLNKLKLVIENGTEVTLKISSNVVVDCNDENGLTHKLLLTNTEVSKNCTAFANDSSAYINFPKTQFSKMRQSGGLNVLDLMNSAKIVDKIANKAKALSNKMSLDFVIKIDVSRKILPDPENIFGTGITLANNRIKDIRKAIKSLEKLLVKKKDFSIFLGWFTINEKCTYTTS